MKQEWDETKRQATLRERELDFADSAKIFAGPRYVVDDRRKDYGEKRQIMIDTLEGRMVAVVFTRRSDA